MSQQKLDQREQIQVRTTVLLSIIQQLMTTRQNRLFEGMPLTLSQFSVLNHFTHQPDKSWTVTALAEVMEMNQPGITKIVTTLLNKGFLNATTDAYDKRKRYLTITKEGQILCNDIFKSLLPDISQTFSEWDDLNLKQFHQHLEMLKDWLDDNRIR